MTPEGYEFAIAIAVGHAATGKEPYEINLEMTDNCVLVQLSVFT